MSLLDADPDLAQGLAPEDLELVRRASTAAVLELERPSWNPEAIVQAAEPGWLGLFVLEGLMIRRVTVGPRSACELFGAGDVFRPWDADGEYAPMPISLDWMILRPARIAVLDTAFMLRASRWPSLLSCLSARIAKRARYLALLQTVTHLPRTHARLLMLFWLLAERWGRMGRDGVSLELPLTHEVLGMLVGSHRPTVTIALQRLARADLLTRDGSRWLLTRAAVELLEHPESLALVDEDDREAAVRAD